MHIQRQMHARRHAHSLSECTSTCTLHYTHAHTLYSSACICAHAHSCCSHTACICTHTFPHTIEMIHAHAVLLTHTQNTHTLYILQMHKYTLYTHSLFIYTYMYIYYILHTILYIVNKTHYS